MARAKKIKNEEVVVEEVEHVEEAPKMNLVSMTMGATIRVSDFSNIVVSYTINGGDIDTIQSSLLTRIETLFDSHGEEARKAKNKKEVLPVVQVKEEPEPVVTTTAEKSQAYLTAEAYGNNAKTPEAKELWKTQVANSKKLTDAEKAELLK